MSGPATSPLDRSVPPRPGAVRSFEFPAVSSETMANGLELKMARMSRVPLVSIALVMDAGESVLGDAEAGLAVLTGEGIEGGSKRLKGPELAEALEGIGSGISIRTGWDATTVSLTCLADRMEEATGLLAEALLSPAFPEEEVQRLRGQRLAAIRQRQMDPGKLADDAAVHSFFDDGCPYHRPLAGTQASVQGMGPEAVRAFAEKAYGPKMAGMIVVGDVEVADARKLAQDCFGSWSGNGLPRPEIVGKPRFQERRIVVVDRPGSVQSEVRIGHVGVPRATPHFFPLKIFNTILGGAFTSRLMLNLREEQGFTYGVRSRLSFRRGPGPFGIAMAVATDVTAPAVAETVTEVETLLDEGPTEEEIDRARDYIAGVFPLQLETTGQVAARIAELKVHELPDDFYGTYRQRIRQVTPEAALEAGRSAVRPDEFMIVIAGDAEEIEGPLSDLELGPVEVVPAG